MWHFVCFMLTIVKILSPQCLRTHLANKIYVLVRFKWNNKSIYNLHKISIGSVNLRGLMQNRPQTAPSWANPRTMKAFTSLKIISVTCWEKSGCPPQESGCPTFAEPFINNNVDNDFTPCVKNSQWNFHYQKWKRIIFRTKAGSYGHWTFTRIYMI